MNTRRKLIILGIITVMVIGVLAGCGCSKDSKFTGKWEQVPQETQKSSYVTQINTITFNSDNTGNINDEDSITWKVTSYEEPNVIEMNLGPAYDSKHYYYDSKNDRLYMNKELNSDHYYQKLK